MALVTKSFSDIITFTRASTATYFNSAGVLTSAAINEARFDYNPATLAARGLLIEEQRTNLCLQSENFSTTWTVTGTATIAVNQITSPSGTLTADLLTTTALGPNRVQQTGTAVVSTTYAMSVFVKAGDINGLTLRIIFTGGTDVNTYADFIFASASFTSVIGSGVFSAQNCGNGWYRLTCVVASGNNTAWDMRIGGLISTAQTGTTAYVWGAQLEAGAFATSYIPTTTTALTRNADVANVNTLAPWYNAAEGTLYVQAQDMSDAAHGTSQPRAASLNDTTTNNTIDISRLPASAQGRARIEVAAANQFNSLTTAWPLATQAKVALAYKANDYAACLGGGTVFTNTASSLIPTVTALSIGDIRTTVSNHWVGWIQRVAYYPRRLSNAELQSITA